MFELKEFGFGYIRIIISRLF